MDIEIWFFFLITEIILCLIPGPAVILVSTQALRYGLKEGIMGAVGIICVNAFYFFLSAIGLVSLMTSLHYFLDFVKFAGALYLIIIGIGMIRSSLKTNNADVGATAMTSRKGLFSQGLITQLSNPKAILFFIALLPQFIVRTHNVHGQFLILGVTSITTEFMILTMYSFLAHRSKSLIRDHSGFAKYQNRIAGVALIAIGARLCF